MNAYINTAALGAWDERLESQMRAVLVPCETRTVAESAAKVARATHPRNQTVRCDDSLRREQVCGYSSQRMVQR